MRRRGPWMAAAWLVLAAALRAQTSPPPPVEPPPAGTPGSDWHAPLTDTYVHAADICVPLGLPAPADPAQWHARSESVRLSFLTEATS